MYLFQLNEYVSQGDIFDDVPIACVRNESPTRAEVTDIKRVRMILLSHDCEYDKPSAHSVIVAEVRPLSEIHANSQGNVRHYRTRNTFYLAALGDTLPESYVDFRRMDRIQKVLIEQAPPESRAASLTEEARLALQRQIAIFFGYGR